MAAGLLLAVGSLVWWARYPTSLVRITLTIGAITLGMTTGWMGMRRAAHHSDIFRFSYGAGIQGIQWGVERLREIDHPQLATMMGCWLAEPEAMFRLGASRTEPRAPFNPESLTEAQKKLEPVLILHGKFGIPEHYTKLVSMLDPDRPVFFVQLVEGSHTVVAEDIARVEQAKEEIKQLYGDGFDHRFLVFCFSRGCEVGAASLIEGVDLAPDGTLLFQGRDLKLKGDIERAVFLGTPPSAMVPGHLLKDTLFDGRIAEIDGENDILVAERSRLGGNQQRQIRGSGHVGLIMHSQALAPAASFLESGSFGGKGVADLPQTRAK